MVCGTWNLRRKLWANPYRVKNNVRSWVLLLGVRTGHRLDGDFFIASGAAAFRLTRLVRLLLIAGALGCLVLVGGGRLITRRLFVGRRLLRLHPGEDSRNIRLVQAHRPVRFVVVKVADMNAGDP